MSKNEEISKTNSVEKTDKVNHFKNLPDGMAGDCFAAICLAILNEWMLSGDTKYLIFASMISNMEKKGYSEDDINKLKAAMNSLMEAFHKPNSFMG